ncbi:MAG: hypothetical protein HYX35_02485 [Proteobacteria bacterium]|nr:hypothetical protein [Pseudomonadota bacterium]
MKTIITTALALGIFFTLANQSVEARYYYYYDAPGYVVPGPYYGYYGYGYHHPGLVPQILGGLFGY